MEYNKIFKIDQSNKIGTAKQYQKKFEHMEYSAHYKAKRNLQATGGGVLSLKSENGQKCMVTITPFSSMNNLNYLEDKTQKYVVLSISNLE